MEYRYQVGGSLAVDAVSYVERKADCELYQHLLEGDCCYIFNSRQMGKSSLLVQTFHRLGQEGYRCAIIDLTSIGSEQVTTLQWYKGLVAQIYTELGLKDILRFKNWWQEQEDFSYLQRLSRFVEELLTVHFPNEKIFIFIDEIDTVLSLGFTVDDLFALIRYCHERRTINSNYQRITFALSGVTAPSDLIRDRTRTPFNIGQAIALQNFQLPEVKPLLIGLRSSFNHPDKLMQEIINWTGGQPFLTQKLCNLIISNNRDGLIVYVNTEAAYVANLVKTKIINNWESQDEPEHFRTIRDRLFYRGKLTGRLLGIYQQILGSQQVKADDSREHIELFLSGLIVKQAGYLKVKNLIYAAIFNLKWVETQLQNLRPYSQTFRAWTASKQTDESRLLKGQALQDALLWSQGKSLSDLDYQYLAASQEADRQEAQKTFEAARLQEVQTRLAETEKRRRQEQKTNKLQKWLLTVVSAGFIITSGLGITAYIQYRRAALGEITALVASANGLYNSNQRLNALVAAIKAKKLSSSILASANLRSQVNEVLNQSLLGTLEYNRLSGETTSIWDIDFSRDGKTLVSSNAVDSIKLWQKDGREIQFTYPIEKLTTAAGAISFSPDGNLLAIAGLNGKIYLHQSNGKLLREIKTNQGEIWSISFSPDSKRLASAGVDGTVKLWSVDGKNVATLNHKAAVYRVVYSPDGKTIASGSEDKTIKLWTHRGEELATFEGHQGGIFGLDFSPDTQKIVSSDTKGVIKLWNLQGEELTSINAHNSTIENIIFHPDGNTFASASFDGAIKLWNLQGKRLNTFLGHRGGVEDIEFSPDGQTIASAGEDRTVRFWQLNYPLRNILTQHDAAVDSLGISPDGKIIASGSKDRTIKLWRSNGTLINTLEEHQAMIVRLTWSHDGQILASGSADGAIKLWNREGQLLNTIKGHQGEVWGVQFSQNDRQIYSGSLNGTVKQWTIDGQLLQSWDIGVGVVGIALSPDEESIAIGTQGLTVLLYDLNGKEIDRLKAAPWSETFSPDGQIIAIADADSTVTLWNWQEKTVTKLEGHQGEVLDVDFSPDGKHIVSSSSDRTVKLWQRDGTLIKTLYGHDAKIRAVRFSPDGKYIVSASADKTVMIWDMEQILNLDELAHACNLVRDYLRHNAEIEESDRAWCDDVEE